MICWQFHGCHHPSVSKRCSQVAVIPYPTPSTISDVQGSSCTLNCTLRSRMWYAVQAQTSGFRELVITYFSLGGQSLPFVQVPTVGCKPYVPRSFLTSKICFFAGGARRMGASRRPDTSHISKKKLICTMVETLLVWLMVTVPSKGIIVQEGSLPPGG